MATWTIDLLDRNAGSDRITAATFRSMKFGYVINSPGACEIDLALVGAQTTRANWAPMQTEIEINRNGVLVWGGYLWGARVELRDTVTVRGEGYYSRLRRRNINADLIYTDVKQHQIAWNIINHVQGQTGGNMNLTQGIHTGTDVLRDRDYCAADYPEAAASIDELIGMDDGIDVVITPTNTISSKKAFRTYGGTGAPRLGTDLSATVTLNQANLMSLTYEYLGDDMATEVITIGDGDCNPPLQDNIDTTARGTYGLLTQVDSIDSPQLKDVNAHGNETIRNLKNIHWTAQATFVEGTGAQAWGAFSIGDLVTLASTRGPAGGFGNFSQKMRVLSLETALEPPSRAFHTVTLDSVW